MKIPPKSGKSKSISKINMTVYGSCSLERRHQVRGEKI
jgi:hypothetical protein